MKREELIAMGISEENVEKIMADHAKVVQSATEKSNQYKVKADKADELQNKLDEIEKGNLSEVEQANKNLEKANARIAELEKAQAISAQKKTVIEKFKVTSEQADKIVKEDGTFDYDVLGKIISDKETAAAQAKEQEIARGTNNPGGGTGGGNKQKTDAEKTAEEIGKELSGANKSAESIVESYL